MASQKLKQRRQRYISKMNDILPDIITKEIIERIGFGDALTLREIEKLTGQSYGALANIEYRALKKLSDLMKERNLTRANIGLNERWPDRQ